MIILIFKKLTCFIKKKEIKKSFKKIKKENYLKNKIILIKFYLTVICVVTVSATYPAVAFE